ncbi:MAG: serine hydrolase [Clostridia bacterium]|nr:serine hydrolase [Clostridia bacterium]
MKILSILRKSLICLIVVSCIFFVLPGLFVNMHSADGAERAVCVFNVKKYKNNGWYEMPVKKMYAPGGKSEIVTITEAENRKSNGWYESPVTTMYFPDGRSEIFFTSEVEEKSKEGWFSEPVALMNKGKEEKYVLFAETEKYRNSGWLIKEYCSGLSELCSKIKQYIEKKSGKYGIYIKNLKTNESLILNDNTYSAASIIKLFVMAGIYSEIENGNLEKTEVIQKYLEWMITVSDNSASNNLVGILGKGNYKKGFETENNHTKAIGCLNTRHLSLFSGCGKYASYGTNTVSPYDCGILLEQIYNRTLVSPEFSDEMLSLLKNQQRRSKIPHYLPEGTLCANKTGENTRAQSDVGIVYSPGGDYIICVITNNAPNGINAISQISLMTYEYFNS